MIRDVTHEYQIPYKKKNEQGKLVWFYPDEIYEDVLNLYLRTQRPEGIYKEKTRLRDPFRKFNKFKMQKYMNHAIDKVTKELLNPPDYRNIDYWFDEFKFGASLIRYMIDEMASKKKKVMSFTQESILLKSHDNYIYDFAYDKIHENKMAEQFDEHTSKNNEGITITECDMQFKRGRDFLSGMGFEHIDSKVSSFADVYGIWLKENKNSKNFFISKVKRIDDFQKCSLQRLDCVVPKPDKLLEQLKKIEDERFANHYSNYNKNDSWKGLVLSGYGGREDFIIKPSEMTASWRKANKEKLTWKVKPTKLMKKLDAVKKFLESFPFQFEFERIRILKLSKGEGELERHTDIQDKQAGVGDKQWARLHFPLQTNKDVKFKQWNHDGTVTKAHMKVGELWYLDMRKPHTAVNFGEEDRYHLIVDVRSDERLQGWLVNSSKKYPPHKEADDYED